MSGGYHARSMTGGVPVRSMKQLFELALQLEPPWRVVSSDLDFERRQVDLRLGFRAGSRFRCPHCGRACQTVKFSEGTWRQPDMIGFEAFVTAQLPSIRCPEHGDLALTVVGERPRLASGPDPRPEHRPARRHVRSPRLARRPSTGEFRASPPASPPLIRRAFGAVWRYMSAIVAPEFRSSRGFRVSRMREIPGQRDLVGPRTRNRLDTRSCWKYWI